MNLHVTITASRETGRRALLALVCAMVLAAPGCAKSKTDVAATPEPAQDLIPARPPAPAQQPPAAEDSEMALLQLTSSAFAEGKPIPKQYTGEGPDISPPLTWTAPPQGTRSFALICDDPDAPVGDWVHWVAFNIPADARGLAENQPKTERLPGGGAQGENDFGGLGYGGPMPPRGKPHHYHFKLYALDTELALESGATKTQVLAAMKGHVLAETRLIGTYQR